MKLLSNYEFGKNYNLLSLLSENKEALYGASDEEIISIKPSLVWKIYAKNDKNDGAKSQNDSTHMRNTGKENYNSNQRKFTAFINFMPLICGTKQLLTWPWSHSFNILAPSRAP